MPDHRRSKGIGYLTAKLMAEKGANLILHSRKLAHTEKVLAEVKAMGVEAYAVGAFVDDGKSGRYLNAPYFTGMTLEEAVKKAEAEFDSPY